MVAFSNSVLSSGRYGGKWIVGSFCRIKSNAETSFRSSILYFSFFCSKFELKNDENPSMMTEWLRLAILSSVVEGMGANQLWVHFAELKDNQKLIDFC